VQLRPDIWYALCNALNLFWTLKRRDVSGLFWVKENDCPIIRNSLRKNLFVLVLLSVKGYCRVIAVIHATSCFAHWYLFYPVGHWMNFVLHSFNLDFSNTIKICLFQDQFHSSLFKPQYVVKHKALRQYVKMRTRNTYRYLVPCSPVAALFCFDSTFFERRLHALWDIKSNNLLSVNL